MPKVGIYWKQLVVFAALSLVIGGGFLYIRSQGTEASVRPDLPNTQVAQLSVDLQDGGSVAINGEKYSGLMSFEPRGDVLNYQVAEAEGTFISQLTIDVTYPKDADPDEVIARHFASFGVDTPEPQVVSNRQVSFTVLNIGPAATYRIELVLPSGTVKPSLYRQVIDGLRTMPPVIWLAVAIAMPVLATFILFFMLLAARRTWKAPSSKKIRTEPPNDSAPGVVGVLVEGKVSPRSLAATLLHMATSGQLVVTHRKTGFTFTKKNKIDGMKSSNNEEIPEFERVLLDKMFLPESHKSTLADIQLRIGRHVYSRKIAEVYLDMYQVAVDLGWFVRDPQAVYKRFRQFALGVILVAVLGFVISLIFGPEPYFYLLGWAGLLFVGVVMYRLTPFLPRRTAKGNTAYAAWIEFKNYLDSPQPLNASKDPQSLFERYLPYAVIFGVEVEWTQRFSQLPFQSPEWYVAVEDIQSIEDFANSLFPFIGTVAYDLSKAREPHAV